MACDLDALRNRMTQALMTPPAAPDPAWDGPLVGALAMARRFGACARAAGAEVSIRAVGVDAFGVPFATYVMHRPVGTAVTTLELTDASRVIDGLAELAGAAP